MEVLLALTFKAVALGGIVWAFKKLDKKFKEFQKRKYG